MIVGAHSIIYTRDAAKDRALFRDVLGFHHVDVGEGWLIFGLPPAEIAFHPGEKNDVHEFYLMTSDVSGLRKKLQDRGVASSEPRDLGWGVLIHIDLPGGGKLGVYEPRHARPGAAKPASKKSAPAKTRIRRPARKSAPKKASRNKAPKRKKK